MFTIIFQYSYKTIFFIKIEKIIEYNFKAFHQNIGQTYTLKAINTWHYSLFSTYKLSNDPSKITWLHKIMQMNTYMLVELCVKKLVGI